MSVYIPPRKNLIKTNLDDPVNLYYWPFPLAPLFKERVRHMLSLMEGDQFDDLLDVGYGCGIIMPELAKRTRKTVHGIDIHGEMNAVYSSMEKEGIRGKVKLYQASVLELPFANNSFDGIFSLSVLEHIKDIDKAIAELKRVIKPGRFMYFGFPRDSILMRLLFIMVLLPGYKEHHPSSQFDILNAIKKNDLVIDRIYNYPFNWGLRSAWLVGVKCHKKA
jgi:ubiquinone/menaquinone biosynthesis C-methylase UbiE